MAHGDKRWILDCAGRWRRSTDRTQLDYYRPVDKLARSNRWYLNEGQQKPRCPQCRHVWKQWEDHFAAARHLSGVRRRLWERWKATFRTDHSTARVSDAGPLLYYYQWERQQPDYCPGGAWTLHWRSTCCWRCERLEDAYDTRRWRRQKLGRKRDSGWTCKHERRKYRRQVQEHLRHERYDDILPRRKGYLD